MIVFKLERERPACATFQGTLYYVKDRYLRTYDFATQRDNPLISIRRAGSAGSWLVGWVTGPEVTGSQAVAVVVVGGEGVPWMFCAVALVQCSMQVPTGLGLTYARTSSYTPVIAIM